MKVELGNISNYYVGKGLKISKLELEEMVSNRIFLVEPKINVKLDSAREQFLRYSTIDITRVIGKLEKITFKEVKEGIKVFGEFTPFEKFHLMNEDNLEPEFGMRALTSITSTQGKMFVKKLNKIISWDLVGFKNKEEVKK